MYGNRISDCSFLKFRRSYHYVARRAFVVYKCEALGCRLRCGCRVASGKIGWCVSVQHSWRVHPRFPIRCPIRPGPAPRPASRPAFLVSCSPGSNSGTFLSKSGRLGRVGHFLAGRGERLKELAGVPKWPPEWDARNTMSALLKGQSADMMLEFNSEMGSPPSTARTFWSRTAVHSAFGQVVGIALFGPAVESKGPLQWTNEHRFWSLSAGQFNSRLAFLEVIQAYSIGSFMADSILPESGAVELLPVQSRSSKMPLFTVTGCGFIEQRRSIVRLCRSVDLFEILFRIALVSFEARFSCVGSADAATRISHLPDLLS
jgi:hypothetical protein